ncbi:lipopolysaccharide biosynthesis protein [Desulforhopalus singaporensis]|uniref:Membrane protein involved in the export of O-antigen and teichoic acid n=1 Tax=Desulforhopalus singaporensis TaxID=91360 RepID=A0A1H0QQB9_9BACT|nr:oligosaccharide flippase family protein [Desulforhopalus singaporensis]SDP19557.1 Membrane protein involved in the export of O-antigen and teichoic acid [Desulforhopalus singaporensis]
MRMILAHNLIVAWLAKILGFALSLYVARVLAPSEYGHYVFIVMVISLIPIAQLGALQGIVVELPKRLRCLTGTGKGLYSSYAVTSQLLQLVSIFVLFFLSDESVSALGLVALGVHLLLSKVHENCKVLMGAHLEFYGQIKIRWIDEIIRPLALGVSFYMYPGIDALFIGHAVVTVSLVTIIQVCFKDAIAWKIGRNFSADLKKIYSVGFFIFLVWGQDLLFRSIDRWFIKIFYTTEDLAIYGFVSALAIHIWGVGLAYLAPYAQLLYSTVANEEWPEVEKLIRKANRELYLLMGALCGAAIIVYPIVTTYIVGRYESSWPIFCILAIASFCLAANNMQIYYMSSTRQQFLMIRYQFGLVIGGCLFDLIASLHAAPIIVLAICTLICLLIYCFFLTRYVRRDLALRISNVKVEIPV